MNPYIILAILAAWVASVGGAFWYGTNVGHDSQIAGQVKTEAKVEATNIAADSKAAGAVSTIGFNNDVLKTQLEVQLRMVPADSDCKLDDDSLHTLNSALTNTATDTAGNR